MAELKTYPQRVLANLAGVDASGNVGLSGTIGGATSTPTTDGTAFPVQNSSKTASQIYSPVVPPGYFFWDSERSVLDLETGTAVQNGNAFGAYVYNNVPQGSAPTQKNSVGYFNISIAATDHAAIWGINTSCGDNTTNGLATLTGRKLIGYEADFQVNGASTVEGISLIIQGPGTPLNANAVQVSQSSGSTAQWTYGYITDNGASTVAASFGALTASGTNIPSQPLYLNGFGSGGLAYALSLQAANHALNIIDNTLPDGLSIVTGTGNTILLANGSSPSINLQVSPKGTGVFQINSTATALLFLTTPIAVASLPAAGSSAGGRTFVNNSSVVASGNFGAIVAGGGANTVPVYSDGTNWRIG